MMRTSKIDMFRQAVRDGKHDAAVVLADMVVETMGYETPTFVLDYLDKQAEHHQAAALVTARSYFFRDSKSRQDRIDLLMKATKGGDSLVAGSAYYLMANELVAEGEASIRVKDALMNSSELGNLHATVMLARGFSDGIFGCDVDIENAHALLTRACEADFGPAKVALAELLLTKDIDDAELNPLELLFDAVEDGVEGASEVLFALGAGMGPNQQIAQEEDTVKLSETVVPNGLNRLQRLRSAVLNEFDCAASLAEIMIANWHGFDSWDEVVTAALHEELPEGRYDEDCDEEQLALRIKEQIKITDQHIDAPPKVLALIVHLLKPTSRSHPPSLRKLDELVEADKGLS